MVVFVMACGPVVGRHSGDPCDAASYRPRCTDGVALTCSTGSDGLHHDCDSFGCECYVNDHISRADCNDSGERCVVDKDGARRE